MEDNLTMSTFQQHIFSNIFPKHVKLTSSMARL